MTLSLRTLPLATTLSCALVLVACDEEPASAPIARELEDMRADNVVFGLEHVMTRQGIRQAVVYADTAFNFEDSTVVHLHGNVRLTSFSEDGGAELAQVTSEWGRLNLANNAMVARGDAVLLIRADERRIESPELHYAPERNEIWSDSSSVMYTDDRIIEGSGFDSDLDFDRPTIRNARTRSR